MYTFFCYIKICLILFYFIFISADLDITVNLLIQIDKLVQLLESPVFTCIYEKIYIYLFI